MIVNVFVIDEDPLQYNLFLFIHSNISNFLIKMKMIVNVFKTMSS